MQRCQRRFKSRPPFSFFAIQNTPLHSKEANTSVYICAAVRHRFGSSLSELDGSSFTWQTAEKEKTVKRQAEAAIKTKSLEWNDLLGLEFINVTVVQVRSV